MKRKLPLTERRINIGNFRNQFLDDGATKIFIRFGRYDKSALATNHKAGIILIKIGLNRENGQAINGHTIFDDILSGEQNRAPACIGAIARHINHAPLTEQLSLAKQGHSKI